MFAGGLCALLLQSLHPLAMAGVDQHSNWRRDPAGRLAATSAYLATVSFADRAAADRASAKVRRIHEHVRGVDTQTGQPYSASDPALLLWVHATFVESIIVAADLYGTPLAGPEADQFTAEMVAAAELVGVPRDQVPATAADLARYIAGVRRQLLATPAARDTAAYLLDPPELEEDVAEIWADVRTGVIAALPPWARELYGLGDPGELTAGFRTGVRQALGVLDAMFLGEPGILEARQRITLRMRAARRS